MREAELFSSTNGADASASAAMLDSKHPSQSEARARLSSNFIQILSDCEDVAFTGGKAANLGRLIRSGFAVPGGFAITTAAYRQAAAQSDSDIPPEIAREILIAYRAMGGCTVAVRSSATAEDLAQASMAGQYDTFLNVNGEAELLEAVKKCWASLRSPRIEAYFRENQIDATSVAMAVVVQQLVPADAAGVLFTANPNGAGRSEMLIEASWGLGESVVSGRVQPDVIRIDAATGNILEERIADKKVFLPAMNGGAGASLKDHSPSPGTPGEGKPTQADAGEGRRKLAVQGSPHPNPLPDYRAKEQILLPPAPESLAASHPTEQPVDESLRRKACLSPSDISSLWQLGRHAARHFGAPQDIEWAISGGQLYLLQSRPITTLEQAETRKAIIARAREHLHQQASAGSGPWVLHNLAETLPHPTPLTWSIIQPMMSGSGGFGNLYRQTGFSPSPAMHARGFLELIAGRIYMDASRAGEMFFENFPFRYDLRELEQNVDAAQGPPTLPRGSIWQRMRAGRKLAAAQKILKSQADESSHSGNSGFAEIAHYVSVAKQIDLAQLDRPQLIDLWQQQQAQVLDVFAPRTLMPGMICSMLIGELRTFLAENFWDDDPAALAQLISAGGPPNCTVISDAELFEVGRGERPLADWIATHGHRAAGEFDLATPRWREQPDAVAELAANLSSGEGPLARHRQNSLEINRRVSELSRELHGTDRGELDRLVDEVRRFAATREQGKDALMRAYDLLRELALEFGRRLGIGADVFHLTRNEMIEALGSGAGEAGESRVDFTRSGSSAGPLIDSPSGMAVSAMNGDVRPPDNRVNDDQLNSKSLDHGRDARATGNIPKKIESRKLIHRAESRLVLPRMIDSAAIDTLGESRAAIFSASGHKAFAVSAGTATGPARIVHSPAEAGNLGKGYILVCPSTDPSWTPLFVNAAGLVLECGGSLSHGAVVAREMGLPAVVLPDATRILASGQQIFVDGIGGWVDTSAGKASSADDRISADKAKSANTIESDNKYLPGQRIAPTPGTPGEGGGEGHKNQVDANKSNRANSGPSVTEVALSPDPADVHLSHNQLPPPAGRKDRHAARLALYFAAGWSVYLAAFFFLPAKFVQQPTITLLDHLLWPIARSLGKPAAVAIVAVCIALITLLAQKFITGNARLRESKRRSAALNLQGHQFPPGSPRHAAISTAVAAAQGRALCAAMIPVGILLGPMLLPFIWFKQRIDPSIISAPAGSSVRIVALVDADYAQPLRLDIPAPHALDETTPRSQTLTPIRPTLEHLLALYRENPDQVGTDHSGADQANLPWELKVAPPRVSAQTSADELAAYLKSGIAPQPVSWLIRTPENFDGKFNAAISAPGLAPFQMSIVVGDQFPPSATKISGAASSPIREAKIVYSGASRETDFWRPLKFLARFDAIPTASKLAAIDIGWLGTYVLAYLPALFLGRRLLGVA